MWLTGWKYRKPITIDNSTNTNALTDYQVLITLDTASLIAAGKMRSDGGDIRFTDSDGVTLLNYWIESGINTASTKIWVKIPSIPASSNKIIYVYYGNPNATSASNGTNTFIFFDDFNRADVGSNWTILAIEGTPIVSIDNGRLYVRGANNFNAGVSVTGLNLVEDFAFGARTYNLANDQGFFWRVNDVNNLYLLRTGPMGGDTVDFYRRQSGIWYGPYNSGTAGNFLNTWRKTEIRVVGATFYAVVDDIQRTSWSDAAFSGGSVGLRMGGAAGFYADDFYVRKYLSPEPTTSVGVEESLRKRGSAIPILMQM